MSICKFHLNTRSACAQASVARMRAETGTITKTRHTDQGDVPGWVMITLMTAALVVAIWAIAGPALQGFVSDAIESVRNEISPR